MENSEQKKETYEQIINPSAQQSNTSDLASSGNEIIVPDTQSPQLTNNLGVSAGPQPVIGGVPSITTQRTDTLKKTHNRKLLTLVFAIILLVFANVIYMTIKNKPTSKHLFTPSTSHVSQNETKANALKSATCTMSANTANFVCEKIQTVLNPITQNSPSLTYYVLFYKDSALHVFVHAPSELISNTNQAQIEVHGNTTPFKGCLGSLTFPYTYKGTPETGCYVLATSQNPNNNQYYGAVTQGGNGYDISIVSSNPINLSDIEMIFNSLNII